MWRSGHANKYQTCSSERRAAASLLGGGGRKGRLVCSRQDGGREGGPLCREAWETWRQCLGRREGSAGHQPETGAEEVTKTGPRGVAAHLSKSQRTGAKGRKGNQKGQREKNKSCSLRGGLSEDRVLLVEEASGLGSGLSPTVSFKGSREEGGGASQPDA